MAQREDERWVEVSESPFDHEREGLDSVREWLPKTSPYRAWSNFEFRDSHGGWHECDLLVLGPGGLYLIELKHYYGTLEGDDTRWRRNGGHFMKSPLQLCRHKAQRLASKLKDAATAWAVEKRVSVGEVKQLVPFVREAVFLHHDQFVSHMTGTAAMGLYGLESVQAQHWSNMPPLSSLVMAPPRPGHSGIGPNAEAILVELMKRIGLVQRREREAGSWIIQDGVIDEGFTSQGVPWQDWLCNHKGDTDMRGRARFVVSPPGTPAIDLEKIAQVARNEFRLGQSLTHDAILCPKDLVDSELGSGLIYPYDKKWQRLDLWLAEHSPVPLDTALSIIRQLGEGLRYAHSHGYAHRALGAGSVWLRSKRPDKLEVQIRDWAFAGRLHDGLSQGATSVFQPTPTIRDLRDSPAGQDEAAREAVASRWLSEAFRAPESLWNSEDRARLDVFSLGALSSYIITGRPPAASGAELRDLLGRQRAGLDVVAQGGAAPEEIRKIIRKATHPVVRERIKSIADFMDCLDRAQVELLAPEEVPTDPLDALPGAVLAGGRFTVVKRLGKGSTARGLLVTDEHHKQRQSRVLKVALDVEAGRRLDAEAEVLRACTSKSFARLIEGPIEVDGRAALLLENAGSHTLAEELRPGAAVSLDFLQRWGTDILDALVELDRLGIDHRDIKPGNLGVRAGSDKKDHLTLFDFSLSRASAESVEAGTPPYRDPFLGEGRRRRFDSAAERYSAAVVLFEMTTGHPPQFGDGMTLPTMIDDEATIDLDELPTGLAREFGDFFTKALRRDASQRFDTAEAMREAWDRLFTTGLTTLAPTDEDEIKAAQATLDTRLVDAGVTTRGLSALARFKVDTVRDFLVKVDAGHRYPRVAAATREHLRQRRAAWENRLGKQQIVGKEVLVDGVEAVAASLIAACGPGKATVRRAMVEAVLGVAGNAEAFTPAPMLGAALPDRVPPNRAKEIIPEALGEWAADEQSRAALDAVISALEERIQEFGGAITLGEAAGAVLDAAQEVTREKSLIRRAEGLLRLALERRLMLRAAAEKAAEQMGDHWSDDSSEEAVPPRISVRRRDGRLILLGTDPELFDALQAVGKTTETLVTQSAGEDFSVIVPASSASRELAAALAPFDAALSASHTKQLRIPDAARATARLLRVGAELAPHAAVAATLDLHHVDLPQHVALAESFRGETDRAVYAPRDVRERVMLRFPAVAPLPDRPALDAVVSQSGGGLRWDEQRRGYVLAGSTQALSSLGPVSPTMPVVGSSGAVLDATAAALERSVAIRSFLALGVSGHELAAAEAMLKQTYGAQSIDVTGVLIDAMRSTAEQHGVPWDVVLESDARGTDTQDWANLSHLVDICLPDVVAQISAAVADTSQGDTPVLLTEAAPLARYRHLDVMTRWSDLTLPRGRAVWLMVPQQENARGATLDGAPIPLGSPGQFIAVRPQWTPPSTTDTSSEKMTAAQPAEGARQ